MANNADFKSMVKNLGPKQKEALVTMAVVLALLIVAKKAYDIPMAKVVLLNQQIADEDEKRLTLERIVALNERLKKYQDRGWDNTDFDVVVERVSTVGRAIGLKIFTIMPLEKKTEKNVLFIPFTVNGEGTYRQILTFVQTLEREKQIFRFRDVSLSPAGSWQKAAGEVPLGILLTGEAVHFNK